MTRYLDDLYESISNLHPQNKDPHTVGVTDIVGSIKALALKKKVDLPTNKRDTFRAFKGTALHNQIAMLFATTRIKNEFYADYLRAVLNGDYVEIKPEFLREITKDEEYLIEYPVKLTIDDIIVKGVIDLVSFPDEKLVDWKTASTYKYVFGTYANYEKQLSIYRYLGANTEERLTQIVKADITFFWDGWQQSKTNQSDYPQENVTVVPVEVMPMEDVERYLSERIYLYKKLMELTPQDLYELDICSDEEKMLRPTTYAIKQPKRKSAIKVFNTKVEAEIFVRDNPDKKYTIEEREGVMNCALYCKAAPFCKQAQEQLFKLEK
jgi:hypothetical protein